MATIRTERARLSALKAQLLYVERNSSFFRDALASHGIRAADLRSWEQFLDAPQIMDKVRERELLDESSVTLGHPFGAHLCCPVGQVYRVLTTSGTTGVPTWYLFTRRDWSAAMALTRRAYDFIGVPRTSRVLYALKAGWYAGILLPEALRRGGAIVLEPGAEAPPEYLARLIASFQPNVLIGTASGLLQVLDAASASGLASGVARYIITGGEPAASVPALRQRLEEGFGGTVYEVFGPVWGSMLMSCGANPYSGLHFLSPQSGVWIEDLRSVSTDDRIPIADGAVGHALISALDHEAAPMLKYANGDVIRVETDRCSCGRAGLRMHLLGRKEDFFEVGGTAVALRQVQSAVTSTSALNGHFRVVVMPHSAEMLRVVAEVSAVGDAPTSHAVARELSSLLRVPVRIELLQERVLPRTMAKTPLTITEDALAALLGGGHV